MSGAGPRQTEPGQQPTEGTPGQEPEGTSPRRGDREGAAEGIEAVGIHRECAHNYGGRSLPLIVAARRPGINPQNYGGRTRRRVRCPLALGCAHADRLAQQLEQHGPDEWTVTLNLTDDVFLRSYNWARWQLGIPVRTDG